MSTSKRPLPDLCDIAVLQAMPPADQLQCGERSPRWNVLLRAANRRVRKLTIICSNNKAFNLKELKDEINSLALNGMRTFTTENVGNASYPLIAPFNKWNCLMLPSKKKKRKSNKLKSATAVTAKQIANAFSGITELTFSCDWYADYKLLVEIFEEHPELSRQLTSFTLDENFNIVGGGAFSPFQELKIRLFAAINKGMPALERLIIMNNSNMVLDLPVISQLKFFAFRSMNMESIFPSLKRYAGAGVDLQVVLSSLFCRKISKLSSAACDKVVCFCVSNVFITKEEMEKRQMAIVSTFPSLATVNFSSKERSLSDHFTALSRLPKLVHLDLSMNFLENGDPFLDESLVRPVAVLSSVQVLDLKLTINDHNQVEWLNLGRKMPNLEMLCLSSFKCNSCHVAFGCKNIAKQEETEKTVLKCLRKVLPKLHSGLSMSRVSLGINYLNFETAEQVCIAAEKDSSTFTEEDSSTYAEEDNHI